MQLFYNLLKRCQQWFFHRSSFCSSSFIPGGNFYDWKLSFFLRWISVTTLKIMSFIWVPTKSVSCFQDLLRCRGTQMSIFIWWRRPQQPEFQARKMRHFKIKANEKKHIEIILLWRWLSVMGEKKSMARVYDSASSLKLTFSYKRQQGEKIMTFKIKQ